MCQTRGRLGDIREQPGRRGHRTAVRLGTQNNPNRGRETERRLKEKKEKQRSVPAALSSAPGGSRTSPWGLPTSHAHQGGCPRRGICPTDPTLPVQRPSR